MKMRTIWFATIALLVLVVGIHAAAPRISYNENDETFLVQFDKGFVAACTAYTSHIETIEIDGKTVPYEPRSCGMLELWIDQIQYVDDWPIAPNGGEWSVYAELYREDGSQETTNTVVVKH